MNIIIVGSTGLVGSAFLRKAIGSEKVKGIWSYSRSDLPKDIGTTDKLKKTVSSDVEAWKKSFPENASVMFSGIATTRAAAGGLDKQRLIDHDLQVSLAKSAKERGCKCFVLVSSAGANSDSFLGYLKMKGDTERAIADLGFDKTIILRPGMLLGERAKAHDGTGAFLTKIMPWFHKSALQSVVGYPVRNDEIAEATFKFIDELPNGVHYISSQELVNGKLNSNNK